MTASMEADRLQEFVGRMLQDLGAAFTLPLVRIGDDLGIYKEISERPGTSTDLAARLGLSERYLREWLSANAAAGYLRYDPSSGKFSMSPEQVAVFADPLSPVFMLGAFEVASANVLDARKLKEAFRTGEGVAWHDHSACLFRGIERFFAPSYRSNLIQNWLPALEGAEEKLRNGARVADIGCGHGVSTILMAKHFPNSRFEGFDSHETSIAKARESAAVESLGNIAFETGSATDFGKGRYDLVTIFDALHDMGDPVAAARHVRNSLAVDGTFMVVEPMAGDKLEDNINPIGRLYYAGSTMICTGAALAQEGGFALGAQAGEARLRGILRAAGFTRIRRAAATPFNIVLEAKP